MTDSQKAGRELQDEILNTVRKSQAAVVDAIQAWAAAVKSITPDLSDVPGLSDLKVPFAKDLPTPEELVASSYDFAENLLASQRKFTQEVLQATASLFPASQDAPAAVEDTPAKPASAPAKQASAAAKPAGKSGPEAK
jgi:hypothetical protein